LIGCYEMPVALYLRRSAELSFSSLVILALVFPVVGGQIKAALLIYCIVAVLLLEVLRQNSIVCLHRKTFTFLGTLICINGFFVIWGMWNSAQFEGSEEAINVYLFFPLVYLFLISITPSIIDLKSMARILLFVSLVISFITIAQSIRVFSLGIVPGYSMLYYIYPELANDYMNFAFTGGDGYLPRATERLAFLAPFSVALVAFGKKIGLPNKLVLVNFLLVLTAVAFTGRRVFLLIVVLTIVVLVIRRFLVRPRQVIQGFVVALSVALLVVAGLQFYGNDPDAEDSRAEAISADVADDFSDFTFDVRTSQIEKILAESNRNPVLGVGFGNDIATHVRDPQHPWRFELTYFALLFQTGVLGMCLYGLVGVQLIGLSRDAWNQGGDVILPFIIGMCGGLVAAATNPYLNYGTGQWIIFLPVALFNVVLVNSSRSQLSRPSIRRTDGEYGSAGVR